MEMNKHKRASNLLTKIKALNDFNTQLVGIKSAYINVHSNDETLASLTIADHQELRQNIHNWIENELNELRKEFDKL